jgi:hypothetical protein
MARKKKEKRRHFPTDPRYGVKISPRPNDLKALGDRQMLSNQRFAPPLNEETRFQVYLGSLAYVHTWRGAATLW